MVDFIHPGLFDLLGSQVYNRKATIQQAASITRDAVNQAIPNWANLAGHVDLPARVNQSQQRKEKARNQVLTRSTFVVALQGYYPQINNKMRVILDDGKILEILYPEADSERKVTQLVCEEVL